MLPQNSSPQYLIMPLELVEKNGSEYVVDSSNGEEYIVHRSEKNESGFTGVAMSGKASWQAKYAGMSLGSFPDELEAVVAYSKWATDQQKMKQEMQKDSEEKKKAAKQLHIDQKEEAKAAKKKADNLLKEESKKTTEHKKKRDSLLKKKEKLETDLKEIADSLEKLDVEEAKADADADVTDAA